jgi:hygromycin-B 7''-O-kinase
MLESQNLSATLASIESFEDLENFKLKLDLLENVANLIIQKHHLPQAKLTLFAEGSNIVFEYGLDKVIKIFPPFHQHQFKSDSLVLKHLKGRLSIKTPVIEYQGEIQDWPYLVMTKLDGTLLETLWATMDHRNKLIILRELGALIREVHALPTEGLEELDCHWKDFISRQMKNCLEQHQRNKLPEVLLKEMPEYLGTMKEELLHIDKPVLLTGEYTPMNFLVKQEQGSWHIAGLIDFGDCMLGRAEYDLLGPGAFLIEGNKELLREFLLSYGYSADELTASLSQLLSSLMLLHQYSNLKVQVRIRDWESRAQSLKDLENMVWGVRE